MSGIAMLRLLKPIEFYKEKYGTSFYGLNKMYLLMEKQHNRGQDGAGLASIKFDMEPGERFMSRIRSREQKPIQDIFTRINERINATIEDQGRALSTTQLKKCLPYIGEVMLGHVLYGDSGTKSVEGVHPLLRTNNWMHRNLIIAGNFNLTNVPRLFDYLVNLGQHPKEKSDAVTIMEKIGHFLDSEVENLYRKSKEEGITKREASHYIATHMDVADILENASKDWDGGYAIGGLMGHGDAFVVRDPNGIRPVFYYCDDEVISITSERPVLQTTFNVGFHEIEELPPGHALIIKRDGRLEITEILKPRKKTACSFERIYFSRGNDADIYKERKTLGKLIMPDVLEAIDYDTLNSVFSYIPNTAETSFLGMIESAKDELNRQKAKAIFKEHETMSKKRLLEVLSHRIREEKIAVKDVKLRTFITGDDNRDDLVGHVYDLTYGLIKDDDNLVVIDDSIVRGTTLRKSILGMLDRLHPQKIIVVSSAPQIRYPDCYGIDMPRFGDFIAFQAALKLLVERDDEQRITAVYEKCKIELEKEKDLENCVKAIYEPFTDEEISTEIALMLKNENINAAVKVIYQSVDNLHKACPDNLGDWFFTGDYPTPGGVRFVNKAFIRFYEKRYTKEHRLPG